ncbi:tyrosinase family protein [Paenibacillus sp. SM 69]|nr:tyrosinase family protein [Paenibacillus oleatilyticus]
MTAEELLALRRAMLELQRRNGPGSYIYLAGYHGIPRGYCPHGSPLFLPWHRAYIRVFEQSLQAIDSTVALPFWDWTSSESFAEGMATAHSDIFFNDDGGNHPNPLASGPIEDRSRQTRRIPPHNPNRLRSFALSLELSMEQNDYIEFNNGIEGPHGSIHVWVGGPGGDMTSVPRAAYDPIFWSHHATVDRQWAIWQKCNPEQNPQPELMSQELPGFPDWTVADTIKLSSPRLDYTYEGLDTLQCMLERRLEPEDIVPENAIRVGKPRIIVEVRDVARDGESFMVDIFVRRKPSSDGATYVFGGSFGILGTEGLHGMNHNHHNAFKTSQRVDISDAIDKLGLRRDESVQSVELQLTAINKFGDVVDAATLPIGGLELLIIP